VYVSISVLYYISVYATLVEQVSCVGSTRLMVFLLVPMSFIYKQLQGKILKPTTTVVDLTILFLILFNLGNNLNSMVLLSVIVVVWNQFYINKITLRRLKTQLPLLYVLEQISIVVLSILIIRSKH
jgi:hypothetical protein